MKQMGCYEGRSRFTADEAFRICERKLKPNHHTIGKYDCYYNEMGRCELDGEDCDGRTVCIVYRNDISFTNKVRENIVTDPEWCKDNWIKLCRTDKELFIAIYGDLNE